jgi:glyoxylase-like metal-dependent hydrolase (beta-lactamase superfamily II)
VTLNQAPNLLGAKPQTQILPGAEPRFYRFNVGEFECIALSDGGMPVPRPPAGYDMLPSLPPMPQIPAGLILLPLSSLLVSLPGVGNVLIDTGFGSNPGMFGSGPARPVGHLVASLVAAGVPPEDIDVVLISHLHPDHIGGMYSDDGKKLYPNAVYYAGAEEIEFWSKDDLDLGFTNTPPPLRTSAIEAAKRMLGFAGDTLKVFRAGEDVLPGIGSISLPGHSPGQVGFILSSAGKKLLFTADSLTNPVISIETPDVHNPVDMNSDLAVKTRHKVIALLSEPDWQNFTTHFPWPNLGSVKTRNGHFIWQPAVSGSAEL